MVVGMNMANSDRSKEQHIYQNNQRKVDIMDIMKQCGIDPTAFLEELVQEDYKKEYKR